MLGMTASGRLTAAVLVALVVVIGTAMGSPAVAAGPNEVIVRVQRADGTAIDRGLGILRLRVDACTVITPRHVFEPGITVPGSKLLVEHPDGTTSDAELAYLDAPGELRDLSILQLPAGSAHLCANGPLEEAKSVEPYLTSDSLVLHVVEDGGRIKRIPLYVTSFDRATLEVASRLPSLRLLKGYSGAIIETPDGVAVGMLTGVETDGGIGRAYRWDEVLSRLASWYLLGDDVEPGCAKAAPVVVARSGAALSSLPDASALPTQFVNWSVDNVARRLAVAPVLRVTGDLDVDVDQAIVACRVELAKGARIISRRNGPLTILALEIVSGEGASIESVGRDGAPAQGTASAGADGSSFSPANRRGCDATRHGGPGAAGVDGRPGEDGHPSGGIVLGAARVTGPVAIRSVGGTGGMGQSGGRGGNGGNGQGASSGSSSAFDCKCGGSPGGRGGDGGPGGRGGNGGRGGSAGPVVLVVGSRTVPLVAERVGGSGGGSGHGGAPGQPGVGGAGSGGTGYCSGQRGSESGSPGVWGSDGTSGGTGAGGRAEEQDFASTQNAVEWPGFLFTVRDRFPSVLGERR